MTNNCISFEDLSCLYDNSVSKQIATNIYQHIAICKKCSGEFDNLSKTMAFIKQNVVQNEKALGDLNIFESICDKLSPCSSIRDNMSSYIDNELTTTSKQALSEHLNDCVDCNQSLDSLLRTNQVLTSGFKECQPIDFDLVPNLHKAIFENCKSFEADISSFLDVSLNRTSHNVITKHLLNCEVCNAKTAKMLDLNEFIQNNATPNVELNIFQAIAPSITVKKPEFSNLMQFSNKTKYAAAACLVMLVFVGSYFYNNFANQNDELASNSLSPINQEQAIIPDTSEAYIINNNFTKTLYDYDTSQSPEEVICD